MRFDLTDLRLFVNVVEAGSLTAGAERTHLSLASASQRVLGMEETLGATLLVRSKSGVRPNEAGNTLLAHARRVLDQVEQLRAELGVYGQGLQGRVRLLCNTSAMAQHLPKALAGFLAEHPRISVDLQERPSEEIVEELRSGLADLGIVSDAVATTGLDAVAWARDDLVLLVPPGDPLAGRKSIALADAAQCDFVGLANGTPLQEHVAAHARRLGRRLAYRIQVSSFDAVRAMVEQGIGVAVVPRAVLPRRSAGAGGARALPLSDAWARRQLLVCSRADAPLPRNARLLRAALVAAT
ncbi:MAG: LysR family transcriptional regulator [Proteobacteria bacterium]|nr:LysR family transcriptional regulator [Pseudomonadota bacterium]